MGYQSRKPPRGSVHEYRKPLREKRRDAKSIHRRDRLAEEVRTPDEREISEGTLKRLHTLGNQRFGSSPFSDHFNRWLATVEAVLGEFESNPYIGVDEQYIQERIQAFTAIKLKLEGIRRREATVTQEITTLSGHRSRLQTINTEYATTIKALKTKRNREIKQLQNCINQLKLQEDQVIRMKTGFFRGVSKRKREQKDTAIVQELTDKQTELELLMLDFSAQQKALREEFERKKDPVLEQIRVLRHSIAAMESDVSLEERWFACEALADAVNGFLQRKAMKPH
jgi:hypothetical protein